MSLFVLILYSSLIFLLWEGSPLSLTLLIIICLVNVSILIYYSSSSHGLVSALLFCLLILCCVFATTSSLLFFYVSYEFCLLPVLILIFCLGYQPEKLSASLYLLLYTVICSLPLLYLVITQGGSLFASFQSCGRFSLILVLLGFLVKSPIYSLHMWLPKAHVEAPLVGSIFLAGVMLKLGGYGLLIVSPYLFIISNPFLYLTVLGSIVCCVLCYRAWDINTLVAYSSIVHIGVVTLGAFTGLELGFWAACSILLAHSLISPLLFVLAHEVYLSNTSRCFVLGHATALTSGLLGILSLSAGISFGLPPFLGFWVELSLFGSIGVSMITLVLPLGVSTFLGFLYSVSFIIRSCGGGVSSALEHGSVFYVYLPFLVFSLLAPFCSSVSSL